jgi:protein-disulfide isomerase
MASGQPSRRSGQPTRAERRAAARNGMRARTAQAGPSSASRLMRRWAMPAVLAVAGVAAIGIIVSGLTAPPKPVANVVRPTEGAMSAKVVVAEYSDYQCDYCGRWSREVEAAFRTSLVDPGTARFEWHDYAWEGQESVDAANAARCAGDQNQFWAMHDLIYERQNASPNTGAFTKDKLKAMGASLGLDATAFNACVDAGTYNDAIRADSSASQRVAGAGTPAFTVNGTLLAGYQTIDQLAAAVSAAGGSASPAAAVPGATAVP